MKIYPVISYFGKWEDHWQVNHGIFTNPVIAEEVKTKIETYWKSFKEKDRPDYPMPKIAKRMSDTDWITYNLLDTLFDQAEEFTSCKVNEFEVDIEINKPI